jgi:hypothetical protein
VTTNEICSRRKLTGMVVPKNSDKLCLPELVVDRVMRIHKYALRRNGAGVSRRTIGHKSQLGAEMNGCDPVLWRTYQARLVA